jgi:hypothetical protein
MSNQKYYVINNNIIELYELEQAHLDLIWIFYAFYKFLELFLY